MTVERKLTELTISDLKHMLDGYADSIATYTVHDGPKCQAEHEFNGFRYLIGDMYVVIAKRQGNEPI
jgi:hypothetical protein